MNRKLLLAGSFGLAASLLAACGNVLEPADPFPNEDKVEVKAVTSGSSPVIRDVEVAAGQSVLFRVDIPREVLDMDYVWFEVDGDDAIDDLILYDSVAGTSRVARHSPAPGWFDTSTGVNDASPLATAAAAVGPADIDLTARCGGPCIAYPTAENLGVTRYLRVNASEATSFDLYVYGETLDEDGFTRATALELDSDDAHVGAIIYSGMERWYRVPGEVESVTLTHVTPEFEDMAFQANIYLADDHVQTQAVLTVDDPATEEDESTYTFPEPVSGIFIKVYSFNESRAAQAGHARYTISVESPFTVIPIAD